MRLSRIRFLLFSVLLFGCASEYRSLVPVKPEPACVEKFRPRAETAWYHAGIDVAGKHLSGLLLIKNMPDSSQRVVFASEAGVTFFDFEFRGNVFKVNTIISKMDRKAVVTTFQKDFALLLGIPFRGGAASAWSADKLTYYGVTQKKETAYFVTSAECSNLRRLELGSKRKRKVTIEFNGGSSSLPDTIKIVHYIFPMQIQLLRFEKE